ncbi:DinB superfamily protein [Deinococcus reticulitermitis]|uniref:DinB superfamily protein n=1 Tax=Deinococcus reticulitermitis TaxID=856736 RepID=A0A1H7ASJ5_9DEIO|nr:DinB family protein [Deinococcus reticulitermitis]SEJ67604.1 DinB superfamily protein [Deinococcus reticulitermitis]
MTASSDPLRRHVRALLTEPQAHLTLEQVLEGFPLNRINERPAGVPYSAWELLSHLRFAQRDILDFMRGGEYHAPEWPAGYWPGKGQEATAQAWQAELQAFEDDLAALLAILDDPQTELFSVVPNGETQTFLREFLLVADHNAYHAGQLALLGRLLEA